MSCKVLTGCVYAILMTCILSAPRMVSAQGCCLVITPLFEGGHEYSCGKYKTEAECPHGKATWYPQGTCITFDPPHTPRKDIIKGSCSND